MRKYARLRASARAAPALVLAVAAACGAPPSDAQGRAALDAPLVGATMTIVDPDGRVLHTQQTSESGTFRFAANGLDGRRFRVVVTGGSYQGQPFTDTLRRDVDAFDPDSELLAVNAVTTLVSRYAERHPERTLAEASTAVKRFLALPPRRDPGMAVDNPYQSRFSHAAFLAAAPAGSATPISDVIEELVGELDAGLATHRFAPSAAVELPSLSALAKTLAGFAAEEAFGFLFQSVLGAFGAGGSAEILELIEKINGQLTNISASLGELEGKIDAQTNQIARLRIQSSLDTITLTFDKLRQFAIDSQLRCLIDPKTGQPVAGCGEICDVDQGGNKVCTPREQKLKQDAQRLRDQILARGGAADALVILQQQLTKPQLENGLLEAANTFLQSGHRFKQYVHDPAMDEVAQRYEAIQLMAVLMVVEAQRGSDNVLDRQDAPATVAGHQAAVAQQQAKVASFYGTPGTLEDRKDYAEGSQHRIWQATPVRIAVRGESDPPTKVFPRVVDYCARLRSEHTFGYLNWRVPTREELVRIVDDAPADGDRFDYLIQNGFTKDNGAGGGFAFGNNAYYGMDEEYGLYGPYYDSLWHDGVSYACQYVDSSYCAGQHDPDAAYAWCTTDAAKEQHPRCNHLDPYEECSTGFKCSGGDECLPIGE